MVWPPQTRAGYGRIRGLAVYSSDGEKVGIVKRVMHPDIDEFEQARGKYIFIVNIGLLARLPGISRFGQQIYVPESAIQSVADDHLVLNATVADIHNQEWTQAPGEGSYIVS